MRRLSVLLFGPTGFRPMGSCFWPCCSMHPWGSACSSCASSSAYTSFWSAALCLTACCDGAWAWLSPWRGATLVAQGGDGVCRQCCGAAWSGREGCPCPFGVLSHGGGLAHAEVYRELCSWDSSSPGPVKVSFSAKSKAGNCLLNAQGLIWNTWIS